MKIRDALQAKLNVILIAALAFGAGLGVAAELDLTRPGMAAGSVAQQEVPDLRTGASAPLEGSEAAEELSGAFARVAQEVAPAVVTIRVEKRVQQRSRPFPFPFDPFDPFRREPERDRQQPRIEPATGSGFLITASGYVVTNNHVVSNAEEITVQLSDRREFRNAELVGGDPTTDIALLKLDAEGDLPFLSFGRSDSARVGEWVLAIGNPGFGDASGGVLPTTVTAGIISGKGRNLQLLDRQFDDPVSPAIEDFIQTDAAINPGNSGGPLVNMRGQAIGVNTAIASPTHFYIGYGFAVPSELARKVVEDLIEYGEVRRAVLGVSVTGLSAEDAEYYGLDRVGGAIVTGFSELEGGAESPARKAGMQAGDVIVSVDGEPVSTVSDLQRKIRARDPGETVRVTVVHRSNRERDTLRVELGRMGAPEQAAGRERQEAAGGGPLGLQVQELGRDLRARLDVPSDVEGVVVTDVSRRSPAARAGIVPGAVIVDVNGRAVESVEEYRSAVDRLAAGEVANMRIYSPQAGIEQFVSVRVPGDRR